MRTKITKTGIIDNKISGRGGLPFFCYAEQNGIYGLLTGNIASQISGNRKGVYFQQFVNQFIALFINGTNKAIRSFDQSKPDVSTRGIPVTGYSNTFKRKLIDFAV